MKRRYLLIGAGALGILISGATYAANPAHKQVFEKKIELSHNLPLEKRAEISFKQACKDQSLREKYLFSLEEEFDLPYFSDLQYMDSVKIQKMLNYNKRVLKQEIRLSEKEFAITTANSKKLEDFFDEKLNPKVIVFDKPFESHNIQNEFDLIGLIKYHEADHADFFYFGDKQIKDSKLREYYKKELGKKPSVVRFFMELRAYDNQINNLNPQNSKEYTEHLTQGYNKYYTRLWDCQKTNLSNDLKLLFFRPWMTQPNLGKDRKGYFLKPPKKLNPGGKKLYLPEGIKISFNK